MRKTISVICPVHNEETNIAPFFQRVHAVFQNLDSSRYDWELLFTNNRSSDGTLDEIMRVKGDNPKIRVITLSRNFGYQCSIFAGLENAKGDLFMIVDVDCEDPPEKLLDFLELNEQGHDIVYGSRQARTESKLMHLTRKLFYRVNRSLADYEVVLDMAEFFLISRAVRDAITQNKSNYPFLRAEIGYVGFSKIGIPYKRDPRRAGRSHYNLWGNVNFAIAGILSSSTLLLRASGFIGVPLLGLNLVAFFAAVFWCAGCGQLASRWVPALVLLDLSFLVYTALFCALYLARIYKNDLRRPLYFIDQSKSSY